MSNKIDVLTRRIDSRSATTVDLSVALEVVIDLNRRVLDPPLPNTILASIILDLVIRHISACNLVFFLSLPETNCRGRPHAASPR